MSGPVLSMRGVTKSFGDTVALRDVRFTLLRGEVHCLVGENGAGKSTLIKILSGAEAPDAGDITVFGKRSAHLHPDQAMALGIATIYQDVELIGSLTVADNIFLGHEIHGPLGLVNDREQQRAARELMDGLSIRIPERALVEELSPAQKQTLQIVKALHIRARVLIMDEPTSSLGVEETKALMGLVRRLAGQGIAIIYISHFLEEVFEIGDRITVLKDGEVVDTFEARAVDLETVATAMVGRRPSLFFDRERVPLGGPVLEVRGLTRRGAVEGVSFQVRRGEVFGLGGIVGAGRTELVSLLFGVDRPDAGEILLDGRPVAPRSPREAIELGFSLIVEDRKSQALFDLRPLIENISIVWNEHRGPLLSPRKEESVVRGLLERLKIVAAGLGQPVGYLSGGNQQKSVIARWLLAEAKVYLFDEPTKGVDIGAKEQIYRFIVELARAGKAIIMISSDMPELISMSDRIGVMRGGRLVDVLEARQVSEQRLLELFLGFGERGKETV